jgi:hypothetical protein
VKLVLGLAGIVAVALGATTSGTRIPTVTCDDHIVFFGERAPPPDTLVLGRVRMPRPREVLSLPPPYRGKPRLAKRGLSVTAGAPVVLEVPRRYRRVYGLTYGRAGGRGLGAHAIRVRPCPASFKAWTSWAGGYLVRKPACVTLVVRADGRSARVPLNIGRRCARIAR